MANIAHLPPHKSNTTKRRPQFDHDNARQQRSRIPLSPYDPPSVEFLDLVNDIIGCVCRFLDGRSLIALARCCKRIAAIVAISRKTFWATWTRKTVVSHFRVRREINYWLANMNPMRRQFKHDAVFNYIARPMSLKHIQHVVLELHGTVDPVAIIAAAAKFISHLELRPTFSLTLIFAKLSGHTTSTKPPCKIHDLELIMFDRHCPAHLATLIHIVDIAAVTTLRTNSVIDTSNFTSLQTIAYRPAAYETSPQLWSARVRRGTNADRRPMSIIITDDQFHDPAINLAAFNAGPNVKFV